MNSIGHKNNPKKKKWNGALKKTEKVKWSFQIEKSQNQVKLQFFNFFKAHVK